MAAAAAILPAVELSPTLLSGAVGGRKVLILKERKGKEGVKEAVLTKDLEVLSGKGTPLVQATGGVKECADELTDTVNGIYRENFSIPNFQTLTAQPLKLSDSSIAPFARKDLPPPRLRI